MEFKIKPLREKKINTLIICLLITFLPLLTLGILILASNRFELWNLVCVWFIVSCVISLFVAGEIQWYCINDEKIVVKNYLGVVNEVYFCEVQQIVDIELPIVKYKHARCYIFFDKKRNIDNKVFFGTVHNSKFNFVRVPVNSKLSEHVEKLNLSEKICVPKKLL